MFMLRLLINITVNIDSIFFSIRVLVHMRHQNEFGNWTLGSEFRPSRNLVKGRILVSRTHVSFWNYVHL